MLKKIKPANFNPRVVMGKKMVGGEWTQQERVHSKTLQDLHELMAISSKSKDVYLKYEQRINAHLKPADRIRFLKSIALREGIKFQIGQEITEEFLLHLIYGRPLRVKAKQQELF